VTFRVFTDGNRQQIRQMPELCEPVLGSAMPSLAQTSGAAARSLRGWLVGPSARVMAAYSIRICAGHDFRRVLRRVASAPAASARLGLDLAVVFNF
jgi:hypothetical protein